MREAERPGRKPSGGCRYRAVVYQAPIKGCAQAREPHRCVVCRRTEITYLCAHLTFATPCGAYKRPCCRAARLPVEGFLVAVPAGLGLDDLDHKLVPTLVAPDRLLGARIGRGLALEPLLAVAFAMGTHRRLGAGEAAAGGGPGGRRKSRRAAGKEPAGAEEGAGSAVMVLAGEPGLVKMAVELCGDWAEGWGAGRVRRMGGWGWGAATHRRVFCLDFFWNV